MNVNKHTKCHNTTHTQTQNIKCHNTTHTHAHTHTHTHTLTTQKQTTNKIMQYFQIRKHINKRTNTIANRKVKLSKIPATSDAIESFFGVLDLVSREQSKNVSYHVQSGLATWRYNKTKQWFLGLTKVCVGVLMTCV